MILNFDRGHGQNSEQMVQSLMESTQLAFDTLERKLGLSGGSLIDNDGNVVTVTKLVNKSTDKIEANNLAVKGELALGTALSIANGGTGATTAAAADNGKRYDTLGRRTRAGSGIQIIRMPDGSYRKEYRR